jgi:diadenosine tetraphosphate (Ap4A) HIT family hydrolase
MNNEKTLFTLHSSLFTDCLTCQLIARRDAGEAPLWDSIYRTAYWDVVHAYNTSLPGWLVLVARRHIEAPDELNEAEALELGALIRRVSQALKTATDCRKTYVMQFAEAAEHPHVHFHITPRMAAQPPEYRGPRIFGYLGVSKADSVSEERMNEIAGKVRNFLEQIEIDGVMVTK